MSTIMLGVVGRGSGRQKVVIEWGSGEVYPNYPNYPNSLGMFQTKAGFGDMEVSGYYRYLGDCEDF